MTKKFINNFFFLAINRNLNWEIVNNNLVTFKRWNGLKNKKF